MANREPELFLELKGRDAVRMRRHKIGRPEPDRQVELAAVQDGSGRHRGLAVALGAFEGGRLAAQRPAMIMAAARAFEPLRPAHRYQPRRARGLRKSARPVR